MNPQNGEAICLCPKGMKVKDKRNCVAMTSCEEWGTCSQSCVNLIDRHYKCTCHDNYQIDSDLYTCRYNGEYLMLIVMANSVRVMSTSSYSYDIFLL